MSEENTAEAPVKEKKAKKETPVDRYWCGPKANREGTVYHRLQVIVAANPGLTRDEVIQKAIDSGFAAKTSKKAVDNPKQFIGGYLTAGARKGHFATAEADGVAAPNVTKVEKKEPVEKGPNVSETGKAALEALRELLGDDFGAGQGVAVTALAEKIGKSKTQVSRTIDKLEKLGLVETDTQQSDGESVDFIYIQQKGVDFLSAAPAAAE